MVVGGIYMSLIGVIDGDDFGDIRVILDDVLVVEGGLDVYVDNDIVFDVGSYDVEVFF